MGIREKVVLEFSKEQTSGWAGFLRIILIPLSLIYQLAMSVRSFLYAYGLIASRRLVRPVISVGNLTAGGTGKTPLVMALVQELSRRGIQCAVLSRGYRREGSEPVTIVSDLQGLRSNVREAGDEPYLMAGELPGTPVLVGPDRAALGQEAVRLFNVDCLVLDDGFQHLRLRRECNLLLLDADSPFGNGRCLPAGPLREGISAVRRADIIIFNGKPSESGMQRVRSVSDPRPIYFLNFKAAGVRRLPDGASEALSLLQGKRVLAFAGIARPQRFFYSLEKAGAEIALTRIFPDHHYYTEDEMAALQREANQARADFLVTTEKDGVRIPAAAGALPILALRLSAEIEQPEQFFQEILRCIGKSPH